MQNTCNCFGATLFSQNNLENIMNCFVDAHIAENLIDGDMKFSMVIIKKINI